MSDEVRPETAVEPRAPQPHEIAVPSPTGPGTPDWWVAAYGPAVKYLTTLDTTDLVQRKMLHDALLDESDGSAKYLNCDLAMVGYTLLPASKIEEGELHEWVRTIIHLADGGRVAFGSRGIIKSLQLISQLDREPPWNPPLVKRLVNHGRDKKLWFVLIDPPAPGKPPKKAA